MINILGAASALLIDPMRVEHEAIMAGIDGDRHGTNSGYGFCEGILISFRNVDIALVSGTDGRIAESAPKVLHALVGVADLSVYAVVVVDILEGIVHEAAIAALVSVVICAVKEVLFTQRNKLSSLAEVLALQRSSRGEGPAGSARALVLDLGDGTLCPPINCSRGIKSLGRNEGGSQGVRFILENVKCSKSNMIINLFLLCPTERGFPISAVTEIW